MKKLAIWLKGLLTNNIGWKVVSLLASIILWAAVTTTNNPVVSQSYYNIPVQLLNTDSITGIGRVYSIENDGGVINKVTIRAPHSVINDIDSEDIIAVADVNELSSLDTVTVRFKTAKYMQENVLLKNPMPNQDPKVRATNFLEVALGYSEEIAIAEAKRCLNCKNPKCVEGCPVSIKIP